MLSPPHASCYALRSTLYQVTKVRAALPGKPAAHAVDSRKMPVIVEDHTQVPERILTLLTSHLPSSLPLLRRLQFAARLEGGSTPAARILLAYHTPDSGSNADNRTGPGSEALPSHFAAAYLDPSRSPETECWLYSTLEDGADGLLGTDGIFPAAAEPENGQCLDQLLALLGRIRVVEREYTTSRSDVGAGGATAAGSGAAAPPAVVEAVASSAAGFGSGATITTTATTLFEEKNPPRPSGSVLVGSLHECVRQALLNAGVVFRRTGATPEGLVGWDYYEKWLFRVEDLAMVGNGADLDGNLPEGMRWDVVRDRGDAALVRSRTVIPRNECVRTVPLERLWASFAEHERWL